MFQKTPTTNGDFINTVGLIIRNNLETVVEDLILNKIEQDIRCNIAPTFWDNFTARESEIDGFNKFQNAVAVLYQKLSAFMPVLENLEFIREKSGTERTIYGEKKLFNTFKLIVRATIHSQLPLRHQVITEDFYRFTFKVFCNFDKSKGGMYLLLIFLHLYIPTIYTCPRLP